MAEKERIYTIPLRRSYVNTPAWRKAEKSMFAIREFIKRHMKADEVKIGKELNEFVWERGGKKAPAKVKVKATTEKKDEKTIAKVNLIGVEEKKEKKEEKVEKVEIGGKEKNKEKKEEKGEEA